MTGMMVMRIIITLNEGDDETLMLMMMIGMRMRMMNTTDDIIPNILLPIINISSININIVIATHHSWRTLAIMLPLDVVVGSFRYTIDSIHDNR